MKNTIEPTDVTVPQALVELIHERQGHLSPVRRTSLEQQWLARIRKRRRWEARVGWGAAAVASGVAVGAVVVAMLRRVPPPLNVAISGAHLVNGGAIEADKGETPRLQFSDGSEVRLSGATLAALRHVDDSGATVSVRDGVAEVDIPHRPGARWSFEAGPFVIRVTGTAFRFAWNPAIEALDLKMLRGTVELTGPLTNGALALRGGEHLVVHVRRGEVVIREHEAEEDPSAVASGESAAEATVGAPSAVATSGSSGDLASRGAGAREGAVEEPPVALAAPPGSVRAIARNQPRGGVGESWTALVESGAFEAVVADAQRRGLDVTLSRGRAEELAALADAARYTRDDQVARGALLAERRRFPGSTLAREAAFLLGRLEERRNDSGAAIQWYHRYALEDPDGRYVAEALGRRMVLIASESPDEARRVAEDYLRRFPSGGYAARARAVAKAP